ncbi:MAG: HAD family hydrolase, partial [Pseudomonadota bacterium]
RKLAQSGLGEMFDEVEIVSEKTVQVYRSIFERHGDGADRAMMVGNSIRSDVVPMIGAGGWGVYVPHDLTWAVEVAQPPTEARRFHELPDLSRLVDLVEAVESGDQY